jgi:hypothetical protein
MLLFQALPWYSTPLSNNFLPSNGFQEFIWASPSPVKKKLGEPQEARPRLEAEERLGRWIMTMPATRSRGLECIVERPSAHCSAFSPPGALELWHPLGIVAVKWHQVPDYISEGREVFSHRLAAAALATYGAGSAGAKRFYSKGMHRGSSL